MSRDMPHGGTRHEPCHRCDAAYATEISLIVPHGGTGVLQAWPASSYLQSVSGGGKVSLTGDLLAFDEAMG